MTQDFSSINWQKNVQVRCERGGARRSVHTHTGPDAERSILLLEVINLDCKPIHNFRDLMLAQNAPNFDGHVTADMDLTNSTEIRKLSEA
ncbi:hypothetical protein E2C01_002368 [Portunus trituberculatus]|uniref:Uncharacterized protein n=1 Tax=Portunus trituberculatus TaxID=210409 RepID=A0A5B7CLS2_PORTR|nr:hypothetical protein [Portunus trituberculatus]